MAIRCCNPAVTMAPHAVPLATTSECGSAMKQGSLLVRPSLCPSLRSGRRLNVASSSSQRLQLVVASYGIPEYGAPRPYQAPGVHTPNPNPTIVNPGFGDLGKNAFWEYSAPSDYSTPVNYKTPQGYNAPAAYGPGVGVAEDVAVELGQEGVTLEEVKEMELDAGDGGNGGGGGGDANGGGGGGRGDGSGGTDGEGEGKKKGMSMSQKLTLAYAILVGVGGLIGFAKSGSSKSLMAGGGSASILYYVYLNLPSNPVMASAIGLGISTLLLFVMGSRFKESGKVFPAGVVSLFSLVMGGGYIHGIMRTSHT